VGEAGDSVRYGKLPHPLTPSHKGRGAIRQLQIPNRILLSHFEGLTMKTGLLLFLLVLFLAIPTGCLALEVPALKGYVNDYAGMLTTDEADRISHDLQAYESSTSNQIFILTIPALEGEVLEQFSIKVADAWKAGRKARDNGVLLILVKDERKIRIEVGRGLEGVLTDLTSGRIIREDMGPLLREGKNAAALEAAIAKIKLAISGEYRGDGSTAASGSAGSSGSENLKIKLLMACILFLAIAGIASCVHFLLGGAAGAIIAPLCGFLLFHVGAATLVMLVIAGFMVGTIARHLGYIALNIGGSFLGGGGGFSGGGGGFSGGGASGDW